MNSFKVLTGYIEAFQDNRLSTLLSVGVSDDVKCSSCVCSADGQFACRRRQRSVCLYLSNKCKICSQDICLKE